MRKLWVFVASVSCAISVMAPTCGGDDSSTPLDAGDGFDASGSDAGNKSETSTSGDGGSEASTGPGTVTGIVKESVPIPGAKILIGTATATTGADGTFTIPNVASTYTLTVVVPEFGGGSYEVVSYVGLTTRTPIVTASGTTAPPHSDEAVISANLSGTGFPVISPYQVNGILVSPTLLNGVGTASINGNIFPWSFEWGTTTDMLTGDLYVYVQNTGTHAILSMALDTGVVLPSDGGTVFPPNLGLVTPGFTTIGGTYSAPAGYTVADQDEACIAGPSANEIAIAVGTTTAAASTYTCNVPAGFGLNYAAVQLFAEGANGDQATRIVPAPGNTGTINVTLDAPALITAPLDGASGVDLTKPFTWTTPPSSQPVIYSLQVQFDDNYYAVVGASIASATLPDLSVFGIPLPSSDDAQATVIDSEGFVMDDAVDGKTSFVLSGTGNSQTVNFSTP